MKKKLLPLVTAVALLAMPIGQAMAAPKPTPPAAGGQMHMTASQTAGAQPAMSGWDMVKMRTTAKMRAKAARNAKVKGKPAQAVAASTYVPGNGPDYFGTTPNYASSPMPHITWNAGGNVILPIYDPTTFQLTNPVDNSVINPCTGANPYLIVGIRAATAPPTSPLPTCANLRGGSMRPAIDPINKMPQLDLTKVTVSGGIRKFIEPLPGIGAANGATTIRNYNAAGSDLGQAYLPVATPDTTTYPGSDYYVIGVKDYYQQFSPDLPKTKLRGYYQINGGNNHTTVQEPNYLGPVIQAQAGVPVRVRFENHLNPSDGGDLFIPTDSTAMGAGTGPDGHTKYSTNRALIHLHGGLTPWISDGTPHQWTTPAGYTGKYPKGVSVVGVPDMPAIDTVNTDLSNCPTAKDCLGEGNGTANDGVTTFYYTNAQSARMMWYHDHAYGLTRLNVYAGEVSAYLLHDNAEKALIDAGTIPGKNAGEEVPLIIQDKAFVPDNTPSGYFPDGQLTDQDPTWNTAKWGDVGSLWFPHVYMPNQNPYDDSGANAMGRWDYGPWFWPIFGTSAGLAHGEIANPYASATAPWEPPKIPGTPSTYALAKGLATSDVSLVPEAFVDTPLVNGVAYPYLNVDPKAYRFRILNGANDRYFNLQMYCSAADKPAPTGLYTTVNPLPMWASTASGSMPQNAAAGEVPMVPAIQTDGYPADWPTDGRAGGVPYPGAAAGNFIQIGTESGVLPKVAVIRNGPVGFNYNRRDIVVLNITDHGLLMGPAERADVVYDFAAAANMGCSNVILYNDAPTPVPAFDPRNDYYTNNPDQTDSGGTPSTLPGYGPNTRTIMQFRINGVTSGVPATATSFNAAPLDAAIPAMFAATQNKPLVPETAFAAAYPGDPVSAKNTYSRIQSTSLTFDSNVQGAVKSIALTDPGLGYAPTVSISAPGQAGGTPAVGTVQLDGLGHVKAISVNADNCGYLRNPPPTVTISAPEVGTPATATPILTAKKCLLRGALEDSRVIIGFTITNPGTGYYDTATLTFETPAGALPPAGALAGANGEATATAAVDLISTKVSSITLTSGGGVYTSVPKIVVSPHIYKGGKDATAVVTGMDTSTPVTTGMVPKAIQELFEMDYGRMNATMGVELPFSNSTTQTTQPMGYNEPVTEVLTPSEVGAKIGTAKDGTQIWKITHNGVDTHTIHFHLFDVQLLNRVGWDGAIRPPDDNEVGWKESVRMNPLEDAIVAMRPVTPELPFKLPDSVRSLDPTMAADHVMAGLSTTTGNAITFDNMPVNLGWEYVWHCHLLGHEENDMMRPVDFQGSPETPTIGTAAVAGSNVTVNWSNNAFLTKPNPDNPNGARLPVNDANGNPVDDPFLTNFVIERSTNASFRGATTVQTQSDKAGVTTVSWQRNATLPAVTATPDNAAARSYDDGVAPGTYYYRVRAESRNGYSPWSASVKVVVPAP